MKRVIFQIGVTWWRRVSTLALFFVVVIEIAIVALPFLDLKRGIEAQERDDALVAQKLNQIEFMYEFILSSALLIQYNKRTSAAKFVLGLILATPLKQQSSLLMP